jgi:hypothetical protein
VFPLFTLAGIIYSLDLSAYFRLVQLAR